MKTHPSCIVCIVCIACIPWFGIGQVKEDFTDGNFTGNPAWTGDLQDFEVNLAGQLHLVSAGSDTSFLATQNQRVAETEWSFWLKLAFNTSVNNHARIYLASDSPALSGPLNGYCLQVGGADDSIVFMRQTGTVLEPVYRFRLYRTSHSTNTLRFRIRNTGSGLWEAMIDTTGGYSYALDGQFMTFGPVQCNWFGVVCRYTASNALKFYFDEFYVGPIQYDTIPVKLVSAELAGPSIARFIFSEPVDREEAENRDNYWLQSIDGPVDSVKFEGGQPATVMAYLHDPMADGTLDTLLIRNISDLAGNRIKDTSVSLCYYLPKTFDVVISEIMADPDPPVGLPASEYIELYNRSGFPVNLKGWSLRFGSYTKSFPSAVIPSHGYLLAARDPALKSYGECVIIFTSTSSLANEEAELVLYDNRRHVIHSIGYTSGWHSSDFKKEGGWSLEIADPGNPCGCEGNWASSEDATGGTPGRRNSVSGINPDQEPPRLLRGVIRDPVTAEIYFSEMMDSVTVCDPASWTVHRGQVISRPVAVRPAGPAFRSARLLVDSLFRKDEICSVTVSAGLKDCAGNPCDTLIFARLACPDTVSAYDVVINEFLPNPASGGVRFVEIYNRSGKILDLQTMLLASGEGVEQDAAPLSADQHLFFPGDYIAFSPDAKDIIARYSPEDPWHILSLTQFPSFADDSGEVFLLRRNDLALIDRMQYGPSLQNPLLATEEGVSLERFDAELPSGSRSNWHSAAASAGYATPGYRNSQHAGDVASEGIITIEPELFSPDNDGHDDILSVLLRPEEPGCTVDLVIADARGRVVRQLANNVLAGQVDLYTWDGSTSAGTIAPMGIYLLVARFTSPGGTVRCSRNTVVLAGTLSR